MDIPSVAYPALGAIAAAVIGGAISFIVTVLSKEQKTSEFRQAWIDALRNDLSEFVAAVDGISSFLRLKISRGHVPEQLTDFLAERYDDVHRMGVSYHRILLRLNPKEHTKLIDALKELLSVMSSHRLALDEAQVDRLTRGVIAEAQTVLKREWRRVKRGELAFFLTKYVSLALLLIALGLAVAVFRGHLLITFRA